MTTRSPESPAQVDELAEGVRGQFDRNALRDYVPMAESTDPLMQVQTQRFEGPLDLLLHIIKRDALDIFDIPIGQICDAYVQMLERMRELNLDVAAEFLLMAASLAHLKSKQLLPQELQPDAEDDEMDPRAELVRRLLEYQKFKSAAEALNALHLLGRDVFGRPPLLPAIDEPTRLAEMDAMELAETIGRLLERTHNKVVHEVFVERMSVGARINELIELCRLREHLTFEELLAFGEAPLIRSKRVITFLALLEMTRLHLVRIEQPHLGGSIYILPNRDNLEVDAAEIKSSFDQTEGEATTDEDHGQ
ncbi:MAG: segregation/condensation protein A [Deltaproteobacteria bacterium]|nr:segregation/condensation protein A [Deltaproteobacteria bacterium]